jgi:hypothetical protein
MIIAGLIAAREKTRSRAPAFVAKDWCGPFRWTVGKGPGSMRVLRFTHPAFFFRLADGGAWPRRSGHGTFFAWLASGWHRPGRARLRPGRARLRPSPREAGSNEEARTEPRPPTPGREPRMKRPFRIPLATGSKLAQNGTSRENDALEILPVDTKEVPCSLPDCCNSASYKIAAPWSNGQSQELMTYELACVEHFAIAFREAERRKHAYPPSSLEEVGEVGIYRWQPSSPSAPLLRLRGLEATCRSWELAQLRNATRVGPS